MNIPSDALSPKRLARAVLRVHQHAETITSNQVRGALGATLRAGQAMDFAARLRDQGATLTAKMALHFAMLAGLSWVDLRLQVLPALEACSVVSYRLQGEELSDIEEYVAVSAPLLTQVYSVLEYFRPADLEWCALHSIELASWAPLTMRNHIDELINLGFDEKVAQDAYRLALAAGINQRVPSRELREDVVFNPYVWSTSAVKVAAFLRSLPPAERSALLHICERSIERPAVAASDLGAADPAVLRGARKVGLIQAARVVSTREGGSSQTYVFSPLLDLDDHLRRTTEALHERKLFVAHILFGHEKAKVSGGRIRDPVVLVDALLRRGVVGPATNIATDYHLLEGAGIVRVEQTSSGPLLRMVKQEIIEDGLGLLERGLGAIRHGEESSTPLQRLRPPGVFITPERDRSEIADAGAATELLESTILRLREEAKRATRDEAPF